MHDPLLAFILNIKFKSHAFNIMIVPTRIQLKLDRNWFEDGERLLMSFILFVRILLLCKYRANLLWSIAMKYIAGVMQINYPPLQSFPVIYENQCFVDIILPTSAYSLMVSFIDHTQALFWNEKASSGSLRIRFGYASGTLRVRFGFRAKSSFGDPMSVQ